MYLAIIVCNLLNSWAEPLLQIVHYLERLNHHLDVHKERLFDLSMPAALNQVFEQVKCKTVYCLQINYKWFMRSAGQGLVKIHYTDLHTYMWYQVIAKSIVNYI